ncbi:hypothetical protein LguiA_000902 [Lonicera macranthoides]
MADESGTDGDENTEKTAASMGHLQVEETVKTPKKSSRQQDSDNCKKKEVTKTVPLYKLFSFADSVDYVLMLVGTIAAIGNGICMPLMTLIFGELVDTFGETADTKTIVHKVSKVSLKFVYLALGSGAAAFSHRPQPQDIYPHGFVSGSSRPASQGVTHPGISLVQARLTSEFLWDPKPVSLPKGLVLVSEYAAAILSALARDRTPALTVLSWRPAPTASQGASYLISDCFLLIWVSKDPPSSGVGCPL